MSTEQKPAAPVAQPVWTPEECDRVMQTLRYLIGIAERGEGRQMRDDETAEDFVLGYVKRLEAATQPVSEPAASSALLTDDDLCDMAESACQEALAYGVGVDVFMRLVRSVAKRAHGID